MERRKAIVFDTYEEIGALDWCVRDGFLPQLPERVVVVIAGRFSLQEWWRDHDALRELIRPVPLGGVDLQQTREYLAHYGIADEDLAKQSWELTAGHPHALSLAAE